MKDPLENYPLYIKAMELFDKVCGDTDILIKDIRGREIAKQLVRSSGSICANIEEGYGRGSTKEFTHFLRISRGSARETRGWYRRSKFLLEKNTISERIKEIDEIIALLVSRFINWKINSQEG
jgi:four helix bundle protein